MDKLKAQAYDCLAQIELWQQKLKETNEAIKNFKEEVVVPEVVKDEENKD